MANWNNGPDIRAAVERAASRLGSHAQAADVEREAEKILSSEWQVMYGSPMSRTPCRVTLDVCVAACSSRLTSTLRALLYERVRDVGTDLESAIASWTDRPSPRPRLHLRLPDSDVLSAGHEPGIQSILIHAIDRAALDSGVDVVEGPVLTLSNDGDLGRLETLPDLLGQTRSVRPVLEIDDTDAGFFKDAVYALALSLLAPGEGHFGVELAVRTASSRRTSAFVETPSIDVTVPAGSGADLRYAGHEAFRTGEITLDDLSAISRSDRYPFRRGSVLIALSAEHSGNIVHRVTAGHMRRALLSGIPRGAPAVVVVDGYPLRRAPRNRISLTPDTDPKELAADVCSRLGTGADTFASTILLSTPAVKP